MPYRIRRITIEDWPELRELRLEALRDSPTAFLDTHAEAARRPERAWRAQTTIESVSQSSATFVACDLAGRLVGTAAVGPLPDVPDHVHVHAVYVRPAHRGSAGPAAALVSAAIAWARDHSQAAHLTLGVHEDNARARAFYRRIGFADTGKVVPCPRDHFERLIIMGYPAFRASEARPVGR
jgi:RimJ/RimL family protein N-acetyltransferase